MTVVSVEKDYESLSLVLVAEFDAPVERVWQLWADPRQLERWWGPPSHPSTFDEHDLSPGGEVTYRMGEHSGGWWRVTAVDPPRSLEFVDGFANADLPTTTVQVRLADQDGGTRMVLRFTFASRERMEQLERGGAFEVFPVSVGQMDDVLRSGGSS
jgi:uncharacterized protein YndB with AHSA1/START domain